MDYGKLLTEVVTDIKTTQIMLTQNYTHILQYVQVKVSFEVNIFGLLHSIFRLSFLNSITRGKVQIFSTRNSSIFYKMFLKK